MYPAPETKPLRGALRFEVVGRKHLPARQGSSYRHHNQLWIYVKLQLDASLEYRRISLAPRTKTSCLAPVNRGRAHVCFSRTPAEKEITLLPYLFPRTQLDSG